MNILTAYETIQHGIEHSDYFQGCGVAFTKYDECYTGIGSSAREAANDALDQLYESNSIIENDRTAELIAECQSMNDSYEIDMHDDNHPWFFVSIRVKGI